MVTQVGSVETPVGSARAGLVAAAVKQWADCLVDPSGRNTLLYYRDLSAGTLDLDDATPAALDQLLAGRAVSLALLFPDPEIRRGRIRQARTIRNKIREFDEERGIQVGYLAIGMATWRELAGTKTPAAPVVLRGVTIKARAVGEEDFELQLDDELEVNPVLLRFLANEFSIQVEGDRIADLATASGGFDPRPVYRELGQAAGAVPGFGVTHRLVIGTFTYAKQPMVTDLLNATDLLESHDVVAAVAGDPHAQRAIRGERLESDPSQPDRTPPDDEFLVLDADSSQSHAINAVIAGNNLVIKGPPGTERARRSRTCWPA